MLNTLPPGPWVYSKHHHPDRAEGHLYFPNTAIDRPCTVHLEGAASMTQAELDAIGELLALVPAMRDALCVIALDPSINAWLTANDPKALDQVLAALPKEI